MAAIQNQEYFRTKNYGMIKYLFFLGLLVLPTFLTAQTSSITVIVSDSTIHQKKAKVSVSVLDKRDSVLVTYTRTEKDGILNITNIPAGDYILLITYAKYADYMDIFAVKEG